MQTTRKGRRARDHWQMCNAHRDGHPATCNMYRETMQQATNHATDDTQSATDNHPANMRHAAGNHPHTMRHAKDSMQRSANDTQQPTCSIYRQRGKDNRRHATRNGHHATVNGRHATDDIQQAARKDSKTTGNAQHLTDNRQRATASRRHARGSAACYPCEMQQETHGTAAFRISCAASSRQRNTSNMGQALYSTTSAQHGTDATQDDATYDPYRSMQQTQTEPTTRSRQWNARDETNEIRTLAHLGALSVTPLPPRR